MKPVYQTRFAIPPDEGGSAREGQRLGNCLAAALASLLEIPLEAVPDHLVEDKDRWWSNLIDFLGRFGLYPTYTMLGRDGEPSGFLGYTLLGGKSPRGPWGHVVVAKDGEIVHDPHPSGDGLAPDDGTDIGHRDVLQLVVHDPAKLRHLVALQEGD